MDISGVTAAGAVSAALAQKQVYAEGEVQTTMFKKALDSQAQSAMMLIESLPQSASTQALPANLGNHINTTA